MCEEFRVFRGKRCSAFGGEIAVFDVLTPYNFVDMCQIFRGSSCSHRQRVRVKMLTLNLWWTPLASPFT